MQINSNNKNLTVKLIKSGQKQLQTTQDNTEDLGAI